MKSRVVEVANNVSPGANVDPTCLGSDVVVAIVEVVATGAVVVVEFGNVLDVSDGALDVSSRRVLEFRVRPVPSTPYTWNSNHRALLPRRFTLAVRDINVPISRQSVLSLVRKSIVERARFDSSGWNAHSSRAESTTPAA